MKFFLVTFLQKFYDVFKFFVIKIIIGLLITAIIIGGLGSLALWAKFTNENLIGGIGIAIAAFIAVVAVVSLRLTCEEYKDQN